MKINHETNFVDFKNFIYKIQVKRIKLKQNKIINVQLRSISVNARLDGRNTSEGRDVSKNFY